MCTARVEPGTGAVMASPRVWPWYGCVGRKGKRRVATGQDVKSVAHPQEHDGREDGEGDVAHTKVLVDVALTTYIASMYFVVCTWLGTVSPAKVDDVMAEALLPALGRVAGAAQPQTSFCPWPITVTK